VFPGVLIADEVDGLRDMGAGDTTAFDVLILLEVFLHTSLISDSLMELSSVKEQN
jgi:hypothetical protein